ncbi:hypothetical protein FNF28_03228 [Cafeteria roenbergensis]|uniref:Uncharacterized protein n=2 Tax=Cafeteria roenbergensis TaxID=33653 RepID=A0A5A8DQP7_CAFRO|nr:hypothetical protein FNF28_03228 [Cafeteria roenbergensis]
MDRRADGDRPLASVGTPSRPLSVGWSATSPDDARSLAASHVSADTEALLAQQADMFSTLQHEQRALMQSQARDMQNSFMAALQAQMQSQMAQQAQMMQSSWQINSSRRPLGHLDTSLDHDRDRDRSLSRHATPHGGADPAASAGMSHQGLAPLPAPGLPAGLGFGMPWATVSMPAVAGYSAASLPPMAGGHFGYPAVSAPQAAGYGPPAGAYMHSSPSFAPRGFTDEELSEALAGLEREGRYDKYIDVVERMLLPRVRAQDRPPMVGQQWRQAVVAATVFAAKYADEDRWSPALSMLRRAQSIVSADAFMDPAASRELTGFVLDGLASYYYRRRRLQAALQASQRAARAHSSLSQWDHAAKCHLHTACVLARMGRHGEAARTIGKVLQMVEADKLEGEGASPQRLCLVAVAYHNVAVEHIAAGHGEDACVASQSARRVARLCLGLSGRYAPSFEATHAAALAQLEKTKGVSSSIAADPRRLKAFRELSAALYA